MNRQLAFDLPPNVRLEAQDFFVTSANEQAYAMVCAPHSWPDGKLALAGPVGCGKTHLARVFAAQSGATVLAASQIDATAPLPDTALVVEDGDTLPQACEEWLFHAHNHLRAVGLPILVTGKTAPARWDITLPDLASRMSATTTITIDDPDDALLSVVLLKLFSDRQLAPTPNAITYLLNHLPRSFDAIARIVDALDRAALAEHKPLKRTFVRTVLEKMALDQEA
ncbi:MAG: HdaA/DnaA family protein [Octadecabacter sp.]